MDNQISTEVSIDFCRFKGEEGRIYIEVYLDFPRSAVMRQSQGEIWAGYLIVNSRIENEKGLIKEDNWIINDSVNEPEQITSKQRLIDVRLYNVEPGQYSISISAKDSLSGRIFSANQVVTASSFQDSVLTVSDIEFATHLVLPDLLLDIPKFSKGDFGLIPNPRRIFGGNNNFLIYYFEIYPSTYNKLPSDFSISRNILNGIQDTALTFPVSLRTGIDHPFADVDSIYFNDLPNGSYSLHLVTEDSRGSKVSINKRFFVYNKGGAVSNFTSNLNEKDILIELEEIGFLLKKGQKKAINRMTLVEKASFLRNFWKLYDDDISTEDVPLRRTYRERLAEADQRWKTSRKPGHQTDQGRVFLLFGEGDYIERHALESNTKPYEIWTYDDLDGGAIFIFVDRNGLGEYELMHSTKRGEINNPNWYESYVRRSGVDSRR